MPVRLLARVVGLASDKEIVELADNDFITLFSSESDEVRKATLLRAVKALSKPRLRRLLTVYSDHDGQRYYNVYYWLDLGISLVRRQVLHAIEITSSKRS
jgi:hypothetical protein